MLRSCALVVFGMLLGAALALLWATDHAEAASGQAMPVGDVAGYHQIFADDFTQDVPLGSFPAAVADRWMAYPDGWTDTTGNGTYLPSEVVSWHDGLMDLNIHTDSQGRHAVSAPVPILQAGPHDYGSGLSAGRYVVRFRADALHCYKTAWLLFPDDEVWPQHGEIDFPEGALDGEFWAFVHLLNGTTENDQDAWASHTTYTSWHTTMLDWRPDLGYADFYVDGTLIGHSDSRIPNTPMHWVIQTETSTDTSCVPDNATAGHVLLDWVAAYVPASGSVTATPSPEATATLVPVPTIPPSPTATPKPRKHWPKWWPGR